MKNKEMTKNIEQQVKDHREITRLMNDILNSSPNDLNRYKVCLGEYNKASREYKEKYGVKFGFGDKLR